MKKIIHPIAWAGVAALLVPAAAGANEARGPIDIWMSNNEQEVGWGKAVVEAWNSAHPDEQVTAQEIPAGSSSEEVISAAITAGTSPCLVFNMASGAVPGWVRQGGLVNLSNFTDGASYITERGGPGAESFQNADGFYQMPWKSNPVMFMYNKAIFTEAGLDPENPGMATYEDFLAASAKIVESGAAQYAMWPSPNSQFYLPWFDFYPLYLAESGGTPFLVDGQATFDSPAGLAVAEFLRQIYADGLAPQEEAPDNPFRAGNVAMALTGPYAIRTYAGDIEVGFMPVPTSTGSDEIHTFADSKNISMFVSCENQGTAWDFLKFSTSVENDGMLLDMTGQMPLRANLAETYPDFFAANPIYKTFGEQAQRVVDVPVIASSVEVWQTFRDNYTASVIFGQTPLEDFLSSTAEQINGIVQE